MAASVETKKDIAKRSVSAAKYTVVFRVLSQATSLVVTVLLVRALSEHDYGIYNLFYSVICLLGSLDYTTFVKCCYSWLGIDFLGTHCPLSEDCSL
jgi:hypothetical protein